MIALFAANLPEIQAIAELVDTVHQHCSIELALSLASVKRRSAA